MTALTRAGLGRATLARQHLLDRSELPPAELVRSLGALQGQHAASPYLAIAARSAVPDLPAIDRGFSGGELVKASLLRITLHVVHRDDLPAYRAAMLPSLRAAGLNDRRFRDTGFSTDQADRVVDELVDVTRTPRTREEIVEHVESITGRPIEPGVWRALRLIGMWRHAPGPHPWSFGEPTRFVSLDDAEAGLVDSADATAAVVRRYLAAFGPATTRDIGQFTILRRPAIDAALARLDDVIELDGPDGPVLDLADGLRPDDDTPAPPRLLGMWDQTLLAHADRRRVVDDEHRAVIIRRNGDVLASVLVDGRVRGVWRRVDGAIEVAAFEPFDDATWSALDAEAERCCRLLDERDPDPYSSYQRWWRDVPGDHRRLLGR